MRVKDIACTGYHHCENAETSAQGLANHADILKICIKPAITSLEKQKGSCNENRGSGNRLCRTGIRGLFF